MKRLCIGITLVLGVLGSNGTAVADASPPASCAGQIASSLAAPSFGQFVASEAQHSMGDVGQFVSAAAQSPTNNCPAP